MARKLPAEPRLMRGRELTLPRTKVIVVCEGKRTEPDYFSWLVREVENSLVQIVLYPAGGPIASAVNKAIKLFEAEKEKADKSGDSFDNIFQVWCVSDVDEHPKLSESKNKARAAGVKLGLSNPCFELWGVLHYQQHNAPLDRHALQRLLTTLMPKYHHKNSPTFNCEGLKELIAAAKKRAIWLKARRAEEANPEGNPSTSVYKLVDVIMENGKTP